MKNEMTPKEKLKEALTLCQSKRLSEALDDKDLPEPEYSADFRKQINRKIKSRKKPYYNLINTAGKKVAAVIMAVFIVGSTTVFSVKALRDPVVNFIVETYESFSRIVFKNNSDDETDPSQSKPIEKIEDYLIPRFFPAGFQKTSETNLLDAAVSYEYQNNKGFYIIFEQQVMSLNQSLIDTEGVEVQEIFINKMIGLYFKNKGYINIVWDDGLYIFSLMADESIEKETLIKIAESVK